MTLGLTCFLSSRQLSSVPDRQHSTGVDPPLDPSHQRLVGVIDEATLLRGWRKREGDGISSRRQALTAEPRFPLVLPSLLLHIYKPLNMYFRLRVRMASISSLLRRSEERTRCDSLCRSRYGEYRPLTTKLSRFPPLLLLVSIHSKLIHDISNLSGGRTAVAGEGAWAKSIEDPFSPSIAQVV